MELHDPPEEIKDPSSSVVPIGCVSKIKHCQGKRIRKGKGIDHEYIDIK
jgi:hypothetical protein